VAVSGLSLGTLRLWIARLARLLAAGRADIPEEASHGQPSTEDPKRAFAILNNLARGRAIVQGRRQLSEDDLPFVAEIVLSSMPARRGRLIRALALNDGVLTVREAQEALGVRSPETARNEMKDLDRTGLAEFDKEGEPAQLRVRPSWAWIASPEFVALVKNRGVCARSTSSAFDLAEHEQEEEIEGVVVPHTPQKVTSPRGTDPPDPYAVFDLPYEPNPTERGWCSLIACPSGAKPRVRAPLRGAHPRPPGRLVGGYPLIAWEPLGRYAHALAIPDPQLGS